MRNGSTDTEKNRQSYLAAMQPSNSFSGQRAKILALLIAARGGEVPLPQIQACAAQYAARICELRRAGFPIPPPRMETVNGQRHTWYRLASKLGPTPVVASPPSTHRTPLPCTVAETNQDTFPELGDLTPEMEYPD